MPYKFFIVLNTNEGIKSYRVIANKRVDAIEYLMDAKIQFDSSESSIECKVDENCQLGIVKDPDKKLKKFYEDYLEI